MEAGKSSGNGHQPNLPNLIGNSASMQAVKKQLAKIAASNVPVVITGESGTGKEVVAHAIHALSSRRMRPFIAVNCGAIPASLIQSELFGYEKGAFTGAQQRHIGRLEAADGGTILLDEIADLSPDLQVNLLRFLQEKTVERLGGSHSVAVNARVLAATHVDLEAAVARGEFREDLYYRLNVLRLEMPALRLRGDDAILIAEHYLLESDQGTADTEYRFSDEALQALRTHRWPGNVRELINRVRRAVIMSDHTTLTATDLSLDPHSFRPSSLADRRELAEREAIEEALARSGENIAQAARELQVSRMTLYRHIQKHQIPIRITE